MAVNGEAQCSVHLGHETPLHTDSHALPCFVINRYSSNVRSRCGPGNVYFISIRQVSLPVDFPYLAACLLILIRTYFKNPTLQKSGILSPISS